MEYKEFNIKVSNVKQDGDKGKATILLSPYNNIDDGNDRVLPSIGKINDKKKVPLLKQHTMGTEHGHLFLMDSPQGIQADVTLYLEKTKEGVPIFPEAYKHYALLKRAETDGVPVKYSIGYETLDSGYTTVNGQLVRDLKSINIMEGSRVTFAMNPLAQNIPGSVKSQKISGGDNLTIEEKGASGSTALPIADKTVKWDGPTATKNVFDKYTDDKGNISADARKAFFWVDTSKPNEKGSYKLPFADIVDDKLTAIPAGILAAANALRGARTPTDIPEADKKKAATKINTYLKKLKYDEITDEQIKGEEDARGKKSTAENIEHKEANPVEEKALGFADLLKIQNANDMRWKLQDALNSSFRQLMNDDAMTIDDKVKQLETNVDDFATAYKEAMKLVLQASANNKTAKKQVDEVFEIKQLEIETKAGKKISKANKDKIQRCKDGMTDLMSVLEDLINNDAPEDDPDDEEDSKGCKPKTTGKFQNSTNQQKKENDVTLELKSSENLEILENISNLLKGDEQ